jgi:hypothetical protein
MRPICRALVNTPSIGCRSRFTLSASRSPFRASCDAHGFTNDLALLAIIRRFSRLTVCADFLSSSVTEVATAGSITPTSGLRASSWRRPALDRPMPHRISTCRASLGTVQPLGTQLYHLCGLGTDHGLAALVHSRLPLPPHALSLPLQQEAAFELRDSAEQGDHQLAGWGGCQSVGNPC